MKTSVNAPLGAEQEELNGVASIEAYNFPTASGIDTLYYFIESNKWYKDFFHYNIFCAVEQAKALHGGFIPKNTLRVIISDVEFIYFGKVKGFYFFGDRAGAFRVGFKDPESNKGVKDIQVQLNGSGIYSMGLLKLVSYVNDVLLTEISNGCYAITRADLNIFCQYDIGSVIVPENIVTRKRKFERILGKKLTYETLYVGKPPARLRVYDKAIEIDNGSMKAFFLSRYLETFGITIEEPFWNFEFECHRDFLKQYKISSVDDLLANVELLFHKMMEQIRLADISDISQKDLDANRLYKAPNHPLWDYLDQSYHFNAMKQQTIPLERIIYAPREFTSNDFIEEFRDLAYKYANHQVIVDHNDIRDVLHASRLWITNKAIDMLKPFIPIELQTKERKYLLTRNHVAVAILPKSLKYTTDNELVKLETLLTKALHQELSYKNQDLSLIMKHTKIINTELASRRIGQKELELWQQ